MTRHLAIISVVTFLAPASAYAQNPLAPPSGFVGGSPVQLQVVISRTRGEKKISSMPYLLSVKPPDRFGAQVRVGSQVPISTTVDGKQTVIFRDIGTSVDAQVMPLQDGRYSVTLNIDETAVYGDTQEPFKLTVVTPVPVTRMYRSSNTLHMRDGETSQFTAGTDPMTGDTVRVDVTLKVTK